MIRLAWLTLFAVLAGSSVATAQQVPPADEIAAGRDLALGVCANCHVISADQRTRPILKPPAPSLPSIANRANTTPASLAEFLRTTHANVRESAGMPNPELNDDQIRRVVSYMTTLRTAAGARPRPGNVANGRHLASTLCSRCHVVTANGAGGWTDAPSFPTIANRPQVTSQSLEAVIEKPHVHMLNLARNANDAADIAAYILSLRTQ